MADDFNGQATIKDRILMAIGALEGVPKRLDKLESKQEDLAKLISDLILTDEKTAHLLEELKKIITKITEDKIFENVSFNTAARIATAKKKGYWKDKLIGMGIAITLLLVGGFLKQYFGL